MRPTGQIAPGHPRESRASRRLPSFQLFVSKAFREVVEISDLGMHQLFAVEAHYQNGRHAANRQWLIVCKPLDTIRRDETHPPFDWWVATGP